MAKLLAGNVVLVTGAARGIGKTIAETFAENGATVASADLLSAAQWENPLGSPHSKHFVDVRDKKSCASLISEVVAQHGKINHLVNNAGIVRRAMANEVTENDFRDVIDVNLTGTFFMCQAAYQELKQTKGTIVQLGSTSGHSAVKNTVGYSVSKAAVMHLAKVLAYEWAEDGIRVNAVGPTIVPSDMTAVLLDDQVYMAEKMASIPIGRMATQQDVANAVLFLSSPTSAMVTGQTIFIDGGVTIH